MSNDSVESAATRRGFIWGAALASAALIVSRSGYAAAPSVGVTAPVDPTVLDTIDGLLAFVVPGPDRHSVAQGASSATIGGVGMGIAAQLAATIDQTTPFLPHFSATVAATLNALAQAVNPAAPAGFLSPFARLSFAEKAAVFQIMDATDALKVLGGVLPPFVAFFCYSEAAVFDPATRTLTAQPVAWQLSSYQGVADGRDEFHGYLGHRM